MAYEKLIWKNDDPTTPITAERLNHMEAGIWEAHEHATFTWDDLTPEQKEELRGEPGDGDVSTDDLNTALETKADLVDGKVVASQIPELALTKPFTVASVAAMLALEVHVGDVAVITSGNDKGSYMLGEGPSVALESWVPLATSSDIPVKSVNGKTGVVSLGYDDVGASPQGHVHTPQQVGAAPLSHTHTPSQAGAAPVKHTHMYQQDLPGLQDELDSKAPAHQEVTGDWPTTGTPGVLYWKAEN